MLADKIKTITPSFTIGISTKVKEMEREGIEVTNLSIGEPDFYTPDHAKDYGFRAISDNKTKYDSAQGLLELREAIVDKYKNEFDLYYAIDEVVVSSGAKHSITNGLTALLNPGDEVMIPVPYWVSYPEMVKLTGGVPVFVETSFENQFKVTVEDLKKYKTDKTKIIFITNPSNPTGAVYTRSELEDIVKYCYDNNIFIFADEIYEKICYINDLVPVASLSDQAKEITLTINGLSKAAAMTGWRIGYTLAPRKLSKAMATIQGHLVSHPSTVSQWAALGALTECEKDTQKMVKAYEKRRNAILEILEDFPEISVIEPNGAFYLFMNFSKLKDKIKFEDSFSLEVCDQLLTKYHLALVPGIAFGNDDFIRISYATDMRTIETCFEKLRQFIDDLN